MTQKNKLPKQNPPAPQVGPEQKVGYQAEDFVARRLEKVGFTILERNYKKRYGEIDVIAQKDSLLIFVEVKMRTSAYFDPSELITRSKQHKILLVAQEYIDQKTNGNMNCRFDVALVEGGQDNPRITYLADAFEAP